jgi:hypothetical protein
MKFNLRPNLLMVPLIISSMVLAGCGSSEKAQSPEEAAVLPCKTVKSFVDKFLAQDNIGAASYAKVAKDQFSEIVDLDTEFGRFAVVMEQASDDGIVDDFSGYGALLDYCKTKW